MTFSEKDKITKKTIPGVRLVALQLPLQLLGNGKPLSQVPVSGPGNLQKDRLYVKGQIICVSTDLQIC